MTPIVKDAMRRAGMEIPLGDGVVSCAAGGGPYPELVKELTPLEKEIRRHIDAVQKMKMTSGRGGHARQQAIMNAAESLKTLIDIKTR